MAFIFFTDEPQALTLPKKAEAQKPAKKIEVKSAWPTGLRKIFLKARFIRLCGNEKWAPVTLGPLF
jgi:hypothetical protein